MFSFLFFAVVFLSTHKAQAEIDTPKWVEKDYRSPTEWGFYCQSDGKSEDEALQAARLQCSQKMCLLFGVEVDSQVTSNETLKDSSVTSTVVERCPKVRVVGRKEKKKSVECEEKNCKAFVYQTYPKSEYDLEYKRLNQPAISQTIEKTIVIREGKDTFQDPKECLATLDKYSVVQSESVAASATRIEILQQSKKTCKNLDYRDTRLQNQIFQSLLKGTETRDLSTRVLLAQTLSKESTVESRIDQLLTFEQKRLASADREKEVRALLLKHIDALIPAADIGADGKYLLADGSKSASNPYLDEVKSCTLTRLLVQRWPSFMSQDINVCSPKTESKCVHTNIIMIRAQWEACECRNHVTNFAQGSCSADLYQTLQSSCPDAVDAACLKSINSIFKDKYGFTVNF